MNEHEHVLVISCPDCGAKTEYTVLDVLDSSDNAYDKQRLLNGTFFECKCKCGHVMDMAYDIVYRDAEHNVLIYMVHDDAVEGVYTALRLNDSMHLKYGCDGVAEPMKRIVACPHQLQEKILILEHNLDDRIIELAKIFCAHGATETMPDFHSIGAVFNVKNGEFVIELIGEDRRLTAKIPDGFYNHLKHEFAEVLENSNPYIVDEAWALDVLGIDPYDDVDCDGDCENCPHNCDDDFDDEDDECIACERDCNNCDCRRCEDDLDDEEDEFECDGNCEGCHRCDEDGEWREDD